MLRIAITTNDASRDFALAAELQLIQAVYCASLFDDGNAMEQDVLAGRIDGVLDISLMDMIDGAHPDRLTAAGLKKIPQVIVPLGLSHLPDKLQDALGKQIAEKASAAGGPTVIVVGSDTPRVLKESLANWIFPPELIDEFDGSMNDDAFVKRCVEALRRMIESSAWLRTP